MKPTASDYFSADLAADYAAVIARNEQLSGELEESQKKFQKKLQKLEEEANYYKCRYLLLQQELFGRKSERREDNSTSPQLPLPGFGDDSERPKPPVVTERIEYTRSKPKPQGTRKERSTRFPPHLRREVVVVEPKQAECPCCGKEMVQTQGVEITEKLCCRRDPLFVKEYHRHLYVCGTKGCETVGAKAQVPAVFERSLFDHTTAVFFLVNKYQFSLPCSRQHKMLAQLAIKVSSDSVVRIVNDTLSLLMLVYNELVASVLSSTIVIADDTRFTAATGKKKKKLPSYKRGALWGLYGEQDEVVYIFSSSRTHAECVSLLKDFTGYLVVDAYDGFDKVAFTNTKVTRSL